MITTPSSIHCVSAPDDEAAAEWLVWDSARLAVERARAEAREATWTAVWVLAGFVLGWITLLWWMS